MIEEKPKQLGPESKPSAKVFDAEGNLEQGWSEVGRQNATVTIEGPDGTRKFIPANQYEEWQSREPEPLQSPAPVAPEVVEHAASLQPPPSEIAKTSRSSTLPEIPVWQGLESLDPPPITSPPTEPVEINLVQPEQTFKVPRGSGEPEKGWKIVPIPAGQEMAGGVVLESADGDVRRLATPEELKAWGNDLPSGLEPELTPPAATAKPETAPEPALKVEQVEAGSQILNEVREIAEQMRKVADEAHAKSEEKMAALLERAESILDEIKSLKTEETADGTIDTGGGDTGDSGTETGSAEPELHYKWKKEPRVGDQIYIKQGDVLEGDWSIDKVYEKDGKKYAKVAKAYNPNVHIADPSLDELAQWDIEYSQSQGVEPLAERKDGTAPNIGIDGELVIGAEVKVFSHKLKLEEGTIQEVFTTDDERPGLPEGWQKYYKEDVTYVRVRLGEGDKAIDRIVEEEILRAWQAEDFIKRKLPENEVDARERFKQVFLKAKEKLNNLKPNLDHSSAWSINNESTDPSDVIAKAAQEEEKDKQKAQDKAERKRKGKQKWRKRLFGSVAGTWAVARRWGAPAPDEIQKPISGSEPSDKLTEKLARAGINVGDIVVKKNTDGQLFKLRSIKETTEGGGPQVEIEPESGGPPTTLSLDEYRSRFYPQP